MKTIAENRTAFHTTRFTDDEAAGVAADAESCGLTVSAFIRLRVLDQPPPKAVAPAINRDLYEKMNNTGNNLNQLTHRFNLAAQTGDAPPGTVEVLTKLDEVLNAVKGVRLQLLGAGT